jgi:hypothetical protein
MPIVNGYCTLAQVKAALRLTDNADDTLLESAIQSASRRIDEECNRWFYKTNQTPVQVYPASIYECGVLNDIANSSVTVKIDSLGDGSYATTWTQGQQYQLEPLNTVITGKPYRRIVCINGYSFPIADDKPLVQVTAQWGWNAVPSDVEQACILLSMRQFARLNAALGVVGFADMAIQVRAVDPDVRDLLHSYKLITAGAGGA